MNGKKRQTGPLSAREIRAEIAEVNTALKSMAAVRQALAAAGV